MMKPRCKGQNVEISLSNWGYKGYTAECAYYFNRYKNKYSLSIWISRNDIEDRMKISSKKVDSQYIPGTRETIIENICKIVHYASTVKDENGIKYFDRYVTRYEYELSCFERGDELFEQERLSIRNDNEE